MKYSWSSTAPSNFLRKWSVFSFDIYQLQPLFQHKLSANPLFLCKILVGKIRNTSFTQDIHVCFSQALLCFFCYILLITISLLLRPLGQLNCRMVPYAGSLVQRGGHMLRLERSLTSYIAILDYNFASGRPKNNNTIEKVTPRICG